MNSLGGLPNPTWRLVVLAVLATPLGLAGAGLSDAGADGPGCGLIEPAGAAAPALPALPTLTGFRPLGQMEPVGVAALPASPPVPPTALCIGQIRPGASINGCTMNFLWSGSDGRKYFGTAGHCVSGPGSMVAVFGINSGPVGSVVFHRNGGVGNDFALIRIDLEDEVHINPQMCHWGGPTSAYATTGLDPGQETRQYGWGLGWGTHWWTRPRPGILHTSNANEWQATTTTLFGDSGSPIILADGRALGVVTHIFVGGPELTFGTKLTWAEAAAEAELGITLDLMTAPLA